MSFHMMIDILKENNKGKIVLVKCGAFYIAIGEDAVFLHEKLGLKCNCFVKNIYTEKYVEYILNVLIKLPRTEKYSIGTEYKTSMYRLIERTMFLNKMYNSNKKLEIINQIDALLNCQRIYLRIMKNNRWIDEKKFKVSMEKIYEIGKILGGLLKYYANNKK